MMTTKFKGLNLIFMLSAINITLSEILTDIKWRPVGGDPLKDPTFDYRPPVLNRVLLKQANHEPIKRNFYVSQEYSPSSNFNPFMRSHPIHPIPMHWKNRDWNIHQPGSTSTLNYHPFTKSQTPTPITSPLPSMFVTSSGFVTEQPLNRPPMIQNNFKDDSKTTTSKSLFSILQTETAAPLPFSLKTESTYPAQLNDNTINSINSMVDLDQNYVYSNHNQPLIIEGHSKVRRQNENLLKYMQRASGKKTTTSDLENQDVPKNYPEFSIEKNSAKKDIRSNKEKRTGLLLSILDSFLQSEKSETEN